MSKLVEYIETGKTYIVAEMSANHAGSLDAALEIVDAAKETGADCLTKLKRFKMRSMGLSDSEFVVKLKSNYGVYRFFGDPHPYHSKCTSSGSSTFTRTTSHGWSGKGRMGDIRVMPCAMLNDRMRLHLDEPARGNASAQPPVSRCDLLDKALALWQRQAVVVSKPEFKTMEQAIPKTGM